MAKEKNLLAEYVDIANDEKGVTFMGRLGTYRYLDMHVTIAEALDVVRVFLASEKNLKAMSVFVVNPLS
jgi:UDP-galactopyranose mutase